MSSAINKKSTAGRMPSNDSQPNDALSASVQVLPLPTGLYLFSVKAAGAPTDRRNGQLRLPAMHVGLGPGVNSEQVEFIAGPSTAGAWLFAQEDLLVTKVTGAGATLVLTSVRAPGGEVLSIKVERLEGRLEPAAPIPSVAAAPAAKAAEAPPRKQKTTGTATSANNAPLPLKIGAHVRARGDMSFADVQWAGRVAPGLWIESFSIKPMERLEAQDIEYKSLTGSGFETPWLTDENMCGTKGMSVPLVGFAVRLKPGPLTAAYDCEYSGYFKSGVVVGPLRNGAPCRSAVANDPLEGLQVRIFKRQSSSKAAALANRTAKPHGTQDPKPAAGNGSGPSFGRYRDVDDTTSKTNGGGLKGKASLTAGDIKPLKPAATKPVNRKLNGNSNSHTRPIARRS